MRRCQYTWTNDVLPRQYTLQQTHSPHTRIFIHITIGLPCITFSQSIWLTWATSQRSCYHRYHILLSSCPALSCLLYATDILAPYPTLTFPPSLSLHYPQERPQCMKKGWKSANDQAKKAYVQAQIYGKDEPLDNTKYPRKYPRECSIRQVLLLLQ